jgi:IS30 family transposase
MPYHHLTPSERKVIYSMRCMPEKYSQADIARALGRSRSTISRELKRNSDGRRWYNPEVGNVLYRMRRTRLYRCTKREQEAVMGHVEEALKKKWSPEQIAGRLRLAFPEDRSRWISHETIYRHVREDKANGGKLFQHLRRGRKHWGKRGKGCHPNTYIKGRTSIEQRPEEANQRRRVGDWEGDTMYGGNRKGCLATFVERKYGFLVAQRMQDATAASLNEAAIRGLAHLPRELLKTLTVDNGKEFAHFKALEVQLGLQVFFTHPYSAWERATNENTNGLLRQYFPRKKDLSRLTDEELQKAVQSLNDRPRKRLGYRTPREVLEDLVVALDT